MAIAMLNVAASVDYVLKSDPNRGPNGEPQAGSSVFKLGAMDGFVEAHVSNLGTVYNMTPLEDDASLEGRAAALQIKVDLQLMAREAVRFCLRGWSGILGEDGKEIPFKTKKTYIRGRMYEAVHDDCMAMFPNDVATELYAKIQEISKFSEEQTKN